MGVSHEQFFRKILGMPRFKSCQSQQGSDKQKGLTVPWVLSLQTSVSFLLEQESQDDLRKQTQRLHALELRLDPG